MKTIITTILILITTFGQGQTLMLSVRKATVKAEMRNYKEYQITESYQDYLEYTKDSSSVAYEFERNGNKWICSSASITMQQSQEAVFIDAKTGCNCWAQTGENSWLYETNVFDVPVVVTRTKQARTVTFTYKLQP